MLLATLLSGRIVSGSSWIHSPSSIEESLQKFRHIVKIWLFAYFSGLSF